MQSSQLAELREIDAELSIKSSVWGINRSYAKAAFPLAHG